MPQLALIFRAAPWVAILFLLVYAGRLNDLRERHLHRYEAEHAGRLADRATYEQAQKDAAAKNQAQVSRIKSEQERVTNEVESNLTARLERLRSELRSKGAAPQGSPGRPGAGPDGKAPGGIDEAPRVCLAPDELLRAAENEERHDRLIDWVEQQLEIAR